VQAADLALDIEVTVAVSISVLRGEAGADRVAGGLPLEAFANGSPHLRKFDLRLAVERRCRWRQGIRHRRIQAGNGHDEGAKKALSTHRFAHPSPLSDGVRRLRGSVSMLQALHFRRLMCIKKRTDAKTMKHTIRLQEIITGAIPGGDIGRQQPQGAAASRAQKWGRGTVLRA
jgi:hypothetical protein